MRMGTSTRATGSMIRRTGTARTATLTVLCMKETGSMINSMGMERNRGLMERGMRDLIKRARNMALANLVLRITLITMDSSKTMKFLDVALTSGLMENAMSENGRRIKCMEMDCSNGMMENNMKDSSLTTSVKVKELSSGKTAENTWESGNPVNNTVSGCTFPKKDITRRVNGRMDARLDGWNEHRF